MSLEGKAAIVRDCILERMRSGLYEPGRRIPNDRDLSVDLQVSRVTLGKALRQLEHEGLLTRRVGSGTFVSGGAHERLRGRRLRTIGLISRLTNTPWAMQMIEGMHEVLDALNCDVVWKSSRGDPGVEKALIESMASRDADAFVVLTSFPVFSTEGAAFYEEVSRRVPIIMTDSILYANVTTVTPDATAVGRMAAEYLLEQSAVEASFCLIRPQFENSSMRERHAGFLDRLRCAGALAACELVCATGADVPDQLDAFFGKDALPARFFLLTDSWLPHLETALRRRRQRLDSCCVVCADNWSNAPALYGAAWIEQPFVETGREIARRLLRMTSDPSIAPIQVRLNPRLVKHTAESILRLREPSR